MEEVVKSEPCPSKASSISAEGESLKNKTRDNKVLVEDSYDIELNRRVIYRSSSRVFLDLNLSNVEDKKLEPNLYNTSRVASDLEGASSSQASESTKEATQEKSMPPLMCFEALKGHGLDLTTSSIYSNKLLREITMERCEKRWR
nr:zinc finger, C2H2 [Tanacetum cinerariifolium]